MQEFQERIEAARPHAREMDRRWIYVPYDRLTDETGPLTEQPAAETGVVMMEALGKARRRSYHKKKLGLILAGERHFALRQAERGAKVIYVFTEGDHVDGFREAQRQLGEREMVIMKPAERELRLDVARAREAGVRLREVEDTTWLSTEEDFDKVYKAGTKQFLMDRFYRAMRKKTGILMRGDEPVGGKFSYDAENRKPWKGKPRPPRRPSFAPDAITREALDQVAELFPESFGSIEGFDLPVTREQALEAWQFARENLLPVFGPYEDAMSSREPDLFHSKISAALNVSLILPREILADVMADGEKGRIPLASAEGFIRQILGWREYMRHIHRVTDGYRRMQGAHSSRNPYAGAKPSALDAHRKLPAAYWGVASGLNCLDTVVSQVVREGWSHHITRLMVLSNLANLIGVEPRELTDWFWVAYVDAYDWVVETNVLGMGTFGDGGVTATKPYVSGAAYIHKMSDYCEGCRFDPKKTTGEGSCPFTALYWSFLERNADRLKGNQRMAMPLMAMAKKTAAERKALRERAEEAIKELEAARY